MTTATDQPETITHAAIWQDGVVHTGLRHSAIISDVYSVTHKRVDGEQGFVTNTGRFVGRREAARIALGSGQITKLKFGKYALFSEDLW